jgi:signal transduction histidine kinase
VSQRRVWILALLVWALCAGAVWLLTVERAERIVAEAQAAALSRAEVGAEAIEETLLRTLEAVANLQDLAQARQNLLETGDSTAANALADSLQTFAQHGRFGVRQVAVIGPDGWLAWSSIPGAPRVFLGDREHFQVPRDGRPGLFVSAPLIGRASGQWSVQMTRALHDAKAGFAGVVVVSIDPLDLSHRLAEFQFGAGARAIVLRNDGVILARGFHPEEALGRAMRADGKLMTALREQHNGRLVTTSELTGGPLLDGFRTVAGTDLAVVVGLDAENELAPTAFARPSLYAAAAAISLLSLALTALVLLWLAQRRTRAELDLVRRERETALERLAHAQRLEAIGRLAGGVAHDFNNVLQAVLGGASLLALRPDDGATARRVSAMITAACERGMAISRRLLAFARRGGLRSEAIAIASMLAGMEELLAHTLGGALTVRSSAALDLPDVRADRAQLETVLLNLAINARDAMESTGGELRLAADAEAVATGTEHPAGLAPGDYVRLRVSDTGSGMDEATLARATEPFFTTKPEGRGTGLGLAMARGFAEQSGGALAIQSAPGRGTTVTLWLPVYVEGRHADMSLAPDVMPPGES